MLSIVNYKNKICSILFYILIISSYFLPYFILGQNSIITIHDNLDSDVVWFKVVANSGHLFSFGNDILINSIMNGIPRNSLPPGINFISILFYLFEPFTAYMINMILVHIIGFIGMFLLLSNYIFFNEKYFTFGVSVIFSFLPFYGLHPGIAISGLPLITFCFLNLYNSKYTFIDFLLIFLFAFYSSLIYTGIFILITLFVILMYSLLFKKFKIEYFIGILIMTIGYCISELNLLLQMFDHDFHSHRTDWIDSGSDLYNTLRSTASFFLNGQYHAPSLNSPILTLICFIGFIISLKKLNEIDKSPLKIYIIFITTFIFFITIFYGVWQTIFFVNLRNKISILRLLQWNRFHWLTPFLWYLLFAINIKFFLSLSKKNLFRNSLYLLILLQFLFLLFTNKELINNYKRIYNVNSNIYSQPSFKQFYDTLLFGEINKYIAISQEKYRVLSIGIYPEVAIYNGFYSLDSYQRNYSLEYKHKFRSIIQDELDKSNILKSYFDNWGSRCYTFTSELNQNYNISKREKIILRNLNLNLNSFKNMGGKFILSTVEIQNHTNPNLIFRKKFENSESYWRIFLYEVL